MTTFSLTTYLWNDKVMVYMVTQERMGSSEAAVTYFDSITYHIKNHCQSIALYHSHFYLVMQREGSLRDKIKQLHGDVTKGEPTPPPPLKRPHKGAREALRDKTKNCCTKVHE